MSEDLKDRPAVLRRTPRPAPDEKVDPVDYSPAAVSTASVSVPALMKPEEPAPAGGGVATGAPIAAPAPVTQAPARQAAKPAKASKASTNRKTARREVTFPLSTRLSQEVIDVLYAAAEDEGISVREAIEQAIKSRWGQN
ncbi:MAG: hypothetical protein ABWX85_06155 [Arthrobacter sp.]